MKRGFGYFLMAIILPLSWVIRIGLPIYGIYYIVKTFIDDGTIAGLISIPVVMIGIAIIEFVLDFAMFPLALAIAFLLDEERPTKPQPIWFQRHLNWTMAFIWILILPTIVLVGDMLGISLGLTNFIVFIVPIVIILPLSGWALKQKKRSLWWLLLFIIPFMWLIFLRLENQSLKEQKAGNEVEQDALGTYSTPQRHGNYYVGNKKTLTVHRSDCYRAEQLDYENEVWFESSADAIIQGYKPCKRCNPQLE